MTLITDAKDERLKDSSTDIFGYPIARDVLRDSLRAAFSRAEEAEGKLCRAREALKECQYVIHELLCAGNEDVDGNKAGCFKGCKMAKAALSSSSPCRHAAIVKRVEDTEGIWRAMTNSMMADGDSMLAVRAVQEFLRGEG